MSRHEQQELRKHLSDALDILWINYGNDFGGKNESLISEIQSKIERLDFENEEAAK